MISFCTVFWPNKIVSVWALIFLLALTAEVKTAINLSLEEAVNLALDRSSSLQRARHELSAAQSAYYFSRSSRFPTLSLSAVAFYTDEVAPLDLPFINLTKELGSHENYQFDLKLVTPLYSGGKISSGIKAQRELLNAGEYRVSAEEMKIIYECRRAYLSLMLAQALVSSADASLGRIGIIRQNVNNLFSAGLADSLDLFEADLAYQKALKAMTEQQTTYNNASHMLSNILGVPDDEKIVPTEILVEPSEVHLEKVKSSSELKRAELKMMDREIAAADHMTEFKKAAYLPDIGAFIGYSYGLPNREFVDPEWNDNITLGATLNWNFNFGGQTHHDTRSAGAKAQSIRMARQELEDILILQSTIALENLESAYRQLGIAADEHKIAREKYRLSEESQKRGGISINRLLEVEAELAASEKMHQASIINCYIAETEHLFATGTLKNDGGL